MRRLSGHQTRRRRERGAAAVIVALVVAFVALPALALSVDVGNIMFERRQLQNGADATSIALAQACSGGTTACDANARQAELNQLAGSNAKDTPSSPTDRAQLNTSMPTTGTPKKGQCARPPTGVTYSNMPACSSATDNAAQRTAALETLVQCPPLGDYYISGAGKDLGYVETYVQTKSSAADNTLLPSIFGNWLTGGGTHPGACARAAWGPGAPSSTTVISLTMSECDWKYQVGTPPTFPAAPVGAWPGYGGANQPAWPAQEVAVYSKDNPVPGCDTSSPGGTTPGGFAWLAGQGCTATMDDNHWVTTDPGANPECSQAQLTQYRGRVIFVPIFDCKADTIQNPIPSETASPGYCNSANGQNANYHISGFAPFYLSGWFFSSAANSKMESIKPPAGRYLCSGNDRCLFGWFTTGAIPAGDFVFPTPTDPNYGVTVVKPAG